MLYIIKFFLYNPDILMYAASARVERTETDRTAMERDFAKKLNNIIN